MKTGFFETIENGIITKSSSRLNASIIIYASLIIVQQIVVFSYISDQLLAGAAAAGTVFVTLAGSAMFFQFNQKTKEVKDNTKGLK